MITIPQYGSMLSIYLCVLAAIPCMILGLFGKKSKVFNIMISFVVIVSILGIHSLEVFEFFVFLFYECVLVYFYYFFRKRCSSELIYHIIFGLTIFPLICVRFAANHSFYAQYAGFTGLSYMCFKIWQVMIEIHDSKIQKLGLFDFFGLLLFFPSFSSGPVSRYEPFKEDYASSCKGSEYFEFYIIPGTKKIFLGIFYKFAVAFEINTYLISKIPENVSFLHIVLYMYAYTLYLFFDFGGYSQIAIGMGYLMGVKLPENFNKPFLACNMKEFWTRWHMSLSTWFNDYVFGRFVLNNMRNGLFENIHSATRWAYLFTMLIMGLWHGFSIHYIIYGIYEGVLLVITDVYVKSRYYRKVKKKPYYKAMSRIICFQFVAFGMLLFSGRYMNF